MKKTAVVLFNLGGPSILSDVKPFLFNLFYDRAIISLPNPFRWLLAKFISSFREQTSKKIYESMGGGSPLLRGTLSQAAALEKKLLSSKNSEFKVFVSMKYWHPFSEETIKKIEQYNPDEILLLPLYPQFSTTTTGSSLEDFYKNTRETQVSEKTMKAICCFFNDETFIEAHVSLIKQQLKQIKAPLNEITILFSAHGLPVSVIEKGDPYEDQVQKTVELIKSKLAIKEIKYEICYQSRVGLKKWLSPSTKDSIIEAGRRGDTVVVVPVVFVSEHSETLVELDKDYREIATKNGVKNYYRVEALSTNEIFIDSLKKICLELSEVSGEERYFIVSGGRSGICPERFCKCINNYKKQVTLC